MEEAQRGFALHAPMGGTGEAKLARDVWTLPPPDNDVNVHYHRSIRLKGCDYAQAGAYFVTMCTQDRACPLGDVVGEEVRLSDAGSMIQAAWEEMSDHYPGAETDAFVVMPNHIHGIIVIPYNRIRPDDSHHRIRAITRIAPTGRWWGLWDE